MYRWSVNRPVPTLGDCSTPLSAVEEFYEFWFAFESWRDFGVHDEHDLGQAACRLERRSACGNSPSAAAAAVVVIDISAAPATAATAATGTTTKAGAETAP